MLPRMNRLPLSTDEDHAAALDVLLLLADAEARWEDPLRALELLEIAEESGAMLSPEYRMKRHLWDAALAV
jgi:hypothetical protein